MIVRADQHDAGWHIEIDGTTDLDWLLYEAEAAEGSTLAEFARALREALGR